MDDKKAVTILLKLLNKNLLNEEKEALRAAIGVLSWTSLSKSRLKALSRARKDKLEANLK